MAFEKLHDYLATFVPEKIPGCDILIYHHGKLIHREQQGYQDYLLQEPMGTEVYYPIYSCSKVVTCAAVMHLIEEGKVSPDDLLSQYIPAFGEVRLADGSAPKTPITLRHCFTMTTGLDYNLVEPHLMEAIRKNPHAGTVELVEAIAKRPLLFEPGTHYQYSLAHDVLAAVVEVVSGKTFEEYLRDWCFKPLGLTHISCSFSEENRKKAVAQFIMNGEKRNPAGFRCGYILTDRYHSGGAGLITTAEDYSKILAALSLGTAGGLLKNETLALMQQNLLKGTPLEEYRDNSNYTSAYGYGFGVRTMMEAEKYGIDTRIHEFGWSGAAGCHAMIDTENELAVFYAQCVLGVPTEFSRPMRGTLRDLIYEEIL